MDISTLTRDQLADLITEADQRLRALVVEEQEQAIARREQVAAAVGQLDALIGPDNPAAPGMTSLTEVRKYSREDMHANAGLGLELAFQALELLARTTRNIAATR